MYFVNQYQKQDLAFHQLTTNVEKKQKDGINPGLGKLR